MISIIEIVIALVLLSVLASFIAYVLGFFTIIPTPIMAIFLLALAVDLVLFIIHRKGN